MRTAELQRVFGSQLAGCANVWGNTPTKTALKHGDKSRPFQIALSFQ